MSTKNATAIFDQTTCSFTVKTPKGEFHNVLSIGGFDNYREMDEYIGTNEMDNLKKNGLMAYLFGWPEKQYIFFYPNVEDGDISVLVVD